MRRRAIASKPLNTRRLEMCRRGVASGFLVLLSLVLLLGACAPAAVPTPTPTKPPAAPAETPTQAAPKPAAAATASPAAQPSPTPRPTTVRFGSPGAVSDAGVYIAIEKGYFKDLGLDVQVLAFQSGPAMIAPLSAGDLEVAGGIISTGLLNAIDRGVALKITAGKGSGVKGFDFSRVTVRKDLIDSGAVKEVKDLKGKKFALPSTKSGAEAIAHYFLKQGGISINDVELVTMGYPDMLAAYANKAIDLALQVEPTLNAGVERGLAVRWPPGGLSAIYGGEYQAATLVLSEQFTKNTDAARRFTVGYVKGLRVYNDAFAKGQNKGQIVSILTKFTSEKDPAVYEKMEMPYLNPDGKMHVPSMKMDFDYFKDMGYYTGKLELQQIIDPQFIDYAVQQLGPYK